MTSVINPTLECECGCNKAQHSNGRGMCIGINLASKHCRCSRFVKLTNQTRRMRLMENALQCAIDMIEDMPEEGSMYRIKKSYPSRTEREQMVRQMKAAIAGKL